MFHRVHENLTVIVDPPSVPALNDTNARQVHARISIQGASRMKRMLCLVLALVVGGLAPRASAQISGGNIYGTVTDQSGAVLPGVDITLASVSIGGQPRTTVTDSQGQFRFLNLDAGTYKVSTNLSGFNKMV